MRCKLNRKPMPSALRDFLLSFCPAAVQREFPPVLPQRTLRSATWGGLAQFFLASLALIIQLKAYFTYRAHQLAPQIAGTSDTVQAGATIVVLFEFLIHPLSALLLYLAIEGFIRFVAGLTVGEVLPCFLVLLAFKTKKFVEQLDQKKQNELLIPDTLESLPDGGLRIASARAKTNWNMSITIGMNGQWFEVEHAEHGASPRAYVYCLRPAPLGKILRGYEEYDAASAIKIETNGQASTQSRESTAKK